MAVSKVIFGSNVLVDLTGDTVRADKLAQGFTAHGADGLPVTGTLTTQTCYTGSGAPSAALGSDGDLYLDLG